MEETQELFRRAQEIVNAAPCEVLAGCTGYTGHPGPCRTAVEWEALRVEAQRSVCKLKQRLRPEDADNLAHILKSYSLTLSVRADLMAGRGEADAAIATRGASADALRMSHFFRNAKYVEVGK